ncbi:unnamed protein product [Rhizoctonia solani]|uniref:DUF6535 domain-containing protein n=1 Tax=Rhizoctonia solani TaxID=456999 RepID=A0A8H3D4I9_9AGAM|nr:unnamed protein product [Rhizoctonia solani]
MSILVPAPNSIGSRKAQINDCGTENIIASVMGSPAMSNEPTLPPVDKSVHITEPSCHPGGASLPIPEFQDRDPRYLNNKIPTEPVVSYEGRATGLDKDGKFWKVYVKETDEWDAELVDGWNKSLDVILVFAALFSAISTAFLMESSQRLQEDPVDMSEQTLLIISQTLLAIANSTAPAAAPPPGDKPFTPPRIVVIVNTLWYMSLSVSVSASFLAMLAKDWCHSFLAGRTGEPYVQARRRQRRWTMIENWKMQELITVLPSLIHLSLLLFAIGLCIYVWELNKVVAIPVWCVCGASVGFYVASSFLATILEDFPYTTIISRTLRSDLVKPLYRHLHSLVRYTLIGILVMTYFVVCIISGLASFCVPALTSFVVKKWNSIASWSNWHVLNRTSFGPSLAKDGEQPLKQDHVTSQALGWIITNCEVNQSVDTALQAIAGANKELPRGPLDQCHAATAIARRLGSSHLYDQHDTQLISLYIRALSFFKAHSHLAFNSGKNYNMGELRSLIRELQLRNENLVTTLLMDGMLIPTPQNIEAMSIGSTAASQALEVFTAAKSSTPSHFIRIAQLLQQNLLSEASESLHPAAIQSLVNAVSLFASCISPNAGFQGPGITFQFLRLILSTSLPPGAEIYGLSSALVFSVLSQHQHGSRDDVTRTAQHLRSLLDYTQARKFPRTGFWFGLLELASHPERYDLDSFSEIHLPPMLQEEFAKVPAVNMSHCATSGVSLIFDTVLSRDNPSNYVLTHLKTIDIMYQPAQVLIPPVPAYVFVIESFCSASADAIERFTQCGRMLSQYTFPTLTADLVAYLQARDIVGSLLARAQYAGMYQVKFFGNCQLWLLYVLYLDSPSVPGVIRDKLVTELDKNREVGHSREALENVVLTLESTIREFWDRPRNKRHAVESLGVWTYRVIECVFQRQKLPLSDHRWQEVRQNLSEVRPELRGLSSFVDAVPAGADEMQISIEVQGSESPSQ